MRDADSRVEGRGLRNAHAGRVVSQRRMTRTNDRRGRRFHTGQERGHVPSAVRGATTCPRSADRPGHRSRTGGERGHVPGAVRGATTCIVRMTREGAGPAAAPDAPRCRAGARRFQGGAWNLSRFSGFAGLLTRTESSVILVTGKKLYGFFAEYLRRMPVRN